MQLAGGVVDCGTAPLPLTITFDRQLAVDLVAVDAAQTRSAWRPEAAWLLRSATVLALAPESEDASPAMTRLPAATLEMSMRIFTRSSLHMGRVRGPPRQSSVMSRRPERLRYDHRRLDDRLSVEMLPCDSR